MYDIYTGYIVSASTPEDARQVAHSHPGGDERTVSLESWVIGTGQISGPRRNILEYKRSDRAMLIVA